MMIKWIVFRAEKRQPGWEDRKFQHTQSLTKILAEHLDASEAPIPELGYRPPEFVRVEQFADPQFPGEKTHYRQGDWEVTRVEIYAPEVAMGEFDAIVLCHCRYNPINAPLKPMPERQMSLDSFGGDKQAYEHWLASEKQPAEV